MEKLNAISADKLPVDIAWKIHKVYGTDEFNNLISKYKDIYTDELLSDENAGYMVWDIYRRCALEQGEYKIPQSTEVDNATPFSMTTIEEETVNLVAENQMLKEQLAEMNDILVDMMFGE